MLVEIEGHSVPHFKAPVNAKVVLWGLESGDIFSIQSACWILVIYYIKQGLLKQKVLALYDKPNQCVSKW